MYKDKYHRSWMGPFPFNRPTVNLAPVRPGVYQILYQGEVAYIGISETSVRERLVKHVSGHGNWAIARRAPDAGYEFVYFPRDPRTACQIESNVLLNGKPPYNDKLEYINYIDNITVH